MSDTKLRPEDLTSEERAFNKLTPTQTELLALLSEECGEVVQVIGKILRHGLESFHPNGGPTNRELLAEEIGDCLCASRLLASAGMLNMASVEDRSAAKMEKVFRYLHHARRALIAPAPEKVAKVCGNCGEKVSSLSDHVTCAETGDYYCQPAPPEPAKVECPNCGEMTERSHSRYEGPGPDKWACQPAPPELSKVCPNCQKPEEEPHFAGNLTGDGGWYFCPGRVPKAVEDHQRPQSAQPVAVGMTEALETVLIAATRCAREEQYAAEKLGMGIGYAKKIDAAIAAVRQQAAQGRKVELGKVRAYFNTPSALRTVGDELAALAELDAAEGKRRE